ncbi:uncharacterized protein LOC115258504 [Aedes albopictus]|uniref:Integrase catalytic domain-containing protein n=1 Tax=Aedes albopictus TaxID=7160 RepID=A0ABM1ZTN3_AEDAL
MLNDSETVKALGINWYPSDDEYGFKVNFSPSSINTKRQMISDSARLFDPFGWLAPVTAKIKILYQHLWLFDVGWDDPLPAIVEGEWQAVKQSLSQLEAIRIPRCIFPCRGRIQLHGFCDASEQAYGAVVYARTTDDNGNVSVVLVAAKSRVAPIKQISLPRLELNGAHLLTDLMRQITEALPHVEVDHWAWTDSSIVLHWLASHPRKWKTFVANRTAAILEYLPRSCWRHVSSKENPADLASRGLTPTELVGNRLWFQGAPWLKNDESEWNQDPPLEAVDEDAMEVKRVKSLHTTTTRAATSFEIEKQLITKCSSFFVLVRLLACVQRAIHNFKSYVRNQAIDDRRTGEATPDELHRAKIQLLQAAQHDEYGQEVELLRKGKSLQSKHILSPLHPFLDVDGTMRVGGRLQNSAQPYDMMHPIILPPRHRVTELLVRDLHLRDLHAGSALLTSTLRQQYWIIGCQTVVRKVVQGCTRCVRLKGKTAGQLMGNLPPARVLATRAFSHVGVDYAGPIMLKAACVRGVKTTKGYLAVFVCLSTRAIHLEVASDLSSDTFLGALKRFISRRGYPVEIRSDNGTNFVG